jgi:AraC-like DNA-binding protein
MASRHKLKTRGRFSPRLLQLAPSAKVRQLIWHPYSMDTKRLEHAEHHPPHEKPGAHLFWILSGQGTLETDGHRYELRSGKRIWFVDMSKPRTYAPVPGGQLIKRGVRFGGPGLEHWHKELGGSQQAQFDLHDPSPLHRAFRTLWRICERKRPGWEWHAHLVLNNMLGVLQRARNLFFPTATSLPAAVVRVLNALDSKPFHDWQVMDLAALAGMSYSGLRNLFSQVCGENIHSFLQRRRLDQAEMLLIDPGLSIKQVAEQMNFSSESYFSRFFKNAKGISPREYRRQMSGQQGAPPRHAVNGQPGR